MAGTKDRQAGTMVYQKSNLLILINFHQNNYIVIEQFHGQYDFMWALLFDGNVGNIYNKTN